MQGLILLDKPDGITSARAVARVKRLLPENTKVGHAGSLDPFATGLLILLVGAYTRRCEHVMTWPKTYEATIKLGANTATDDLESEEIQYKTTIVPPVACEIKRATQEFVGAILQRPPLYSALKVRGKRSCDRIRKGEMIELQARTVIVHRFDVSSYQWPLLHVQIECGRGTYIRAIARDLGEKLEVGGYLTALRRISVGRFRIDQAIKLAALNDLNVASHLRLIDAVDDPIRIA